MTYHVMQDWTAEMSHRQQGVLVLALRGPDGSVKESKAKNIVRSVRGCSMNCALTGQPMQLGEFFENDKFMSMAYIESDERWEGETNNFLSEIDSLNLHFWQHLLHAAAVLGFNHPHPDVQRRWLWFYHRVCRKLHVNPETEQQFKYRLRDGERSREEEMA